MIDHDAGAVIRTLTDDEALLLEPIVESFSARPVANDGPLQMWPVWDFVERRFWEARPDGPDPFIVLSGLPVAGRRLRARDAPYRLYWLGQVNDWEMPRPDTTVGLTIAGLYAYGAATSASRVRFRAAAASLADELVGVIAGLAQQAAGLRPMRDKPAQGTASLSDYGACLGRATRDTALVMPAKSLADLLRHEFAVVNIVGDDGTVDLGNSDLRRFRTMTGADAYVDAAASTSPVARAAPNLDQLALPRAIDYLTAALESGSGWPKGRHVLDLSVTTDAASLALDAEDLDAFSSRITSFCTVVSRMRLPDEAGAFSSDQSVNRLEQLLKRALSAEVFDADAGPALKDVRAIMTLRSATQHRSSKNTREMSNARTRLGLDPVTTNWGTAWQTVAGRAAEALYAIARTLRIWDHQNV